MIRHSIRQCTSRLLNRFDIMPQHEICLAEKPAIASIEQCKQVETDRTASKQPETMIEMRKALDGVRICQTASRVFVLAQEKGFGRLMQKSCDVG